MFAGILWRGGGVIFFFWGAEIPTKKSKDAGGPSDAPKKARISPLFAEPLKTRGKEGKTHKKKTRNNAKQKEKGKRKKARIGGPG